MLGSDQISGAWRAVASAGGGHAGGKVDASELTGFYRWLVETYNQHPFVYAIGSVVFLLLVGFALGLLMDLVLSRGGGQREAGEGGPA